jgi:4-diphosphocytidyl-2-C-methyl-D-erythritol kinase
MEFFAPAKINLTLEVKGRRDDGFHEIESLVCPIALFDRVEIELREEGDLQFTCDDPALCADEDNLVVRAARLFCGDIGLQPHLRIALWKQIPHGAGLGGGSSDAATTLLALDGLFETNLPQETLASLGAELGSDVPFFIYRATAVCRGRGEQVTPAPFPHRLPLLLIKPPFAIPTVWAYQRWQGSREIPGLAYLPQNLAWGRLVNDLERPVFEKYLFLAWLKHWLLEQPQVAGALMSGSGSTVFAVLHENDGATAVVQHLQEQFGGNLWVCLCETLQ